MSIKMPANALAAMSSPTANGGAAAEDVVANAWARFSKLKKFEDSKNAMIEELIFRYEFISEEHRKLDEEHKRDKLFYHSFHQMREALEHENTQLRNLVTQDPFILVLIDGDGMIFHEELLKKGEIGGRQAAHMLSDSVIRYIGEICDFPKKLKVVARMYANLKGLADVCQKAGIVPSANVIEEFSRGFTRGNTCFDFIDVGPGKDRADEKICEHLKLHVKDYRCQQIFFGCSHDNGYSRLLEKYMYDNEAKGRITLLEGVPFEKELAILIETSQFQSAKFGSLFRESKIDLSQSQMSSWSALNETALRAVNLNASGRVSQLSLHDRTPSDSVASSSRAPSVVNTWASKAAAAAALPDTPPISRAKTASPFSNPSFIPRNRKGQRVDPDISKFDKPEVDRVKKLKMCNVHFLRHECPYGDGCTHVHDYKPTAKDLEWLRVVARMAVCKFGSGCEDIKCIYGHRCQAPDRMDTSKTKNGGKTCIFGADCVFGPELHNMDCNVVRFTKV